MAIEEVIAGGIIGISGGLVVLLLQRYYQIRDKEIEMANSLKGLLFEIEGNIETIKNAQSVPPEPLADDVYRYFKSIGKLAGKTGRLELTIEAWLEIDKIYRQIMNINKQIDDYEYHYEQFKWEFYSGEQQGWLMKLADKEVAEKRIAQEKLDLLPLLNNADKFLQMAIISYVNLTRGGDIYGKKG